MGESRVAVVLGATGFVGGAVCEAFSAAGHEVVAVARHRTSRAAAHRFVPLDVATAVPAELARTLVRLRADVVVNATGGWLATEEANTFHHVTLVENLLAGLAGMTSPPRLVQVGSIHEYGPVPRGEPIHEEISPRPLTPYARTKLAGSEAILRAARLGRVDGVVLRAVNVCGPHVTTASFLGSVLAGLRALPPSRKLELRIGDDRRDFLDVRDLADAVVRAAGAPACGRVVNVGRGVAVAIREMVARLVAAAGLPPEVLQERGEPVGSRGDGWTMADIRLAGELLGWAPRIGLDESVRDMWEAAAR
ncbi:NAD-dependent epimerase/dehydratase family protein [Streptosporangium sp. LJ11]|uniref:NAD-dependent epimerase/dehydratase family protein n=1 Tax=Streptosporangium sp. LJ11 TaxID=3436927 RepID=UPI003F7B033D